MIKISEYFEFDDGNIKNGIYHLKVWDEFRPHLSLRDKKNFRVLFNSKFKLNFGQCYILEIENNKIKNVLYNTTKQAIY